MLASSISPNGQHAPEPATSFTCPECGKGFVNPRTLGQHRSAMHGVVSAQQMGKAARQAEPDALTCPECGEVRLYRKGGMTGHLKAAHGYPADLANKTAAKLRDGAARMPVELPPRPLAPASKPEPAAAPLPPPAAVAAPAAPVPASVPTPAPQVVAVGRYVIPLVGPVFDFSEDGTAEVVLPVQETTLERNPHDKDPRTLEPRRVLIHRAKTYRFTGEEALQLRAALAPLRASGDPRREKELDELLAEWEAAEGRAKEAERRAELAEQRAAAAEQQYKRLRESLAGLVIEGGSTNA